MQNRPGAIVPARLTGRLAFEEVTFGYLPRQPVLQEVSFEAAPGQVIGIFGMTGAGKSTLLSLIPRFYDPQHGRILADGRDLRDLGPGCLPAPDRHRVPGELSVFEHGGGEHRVRQPARHAGADRARPPGPPRRTSSSCALPHGYETVLGESGVDLSGGQRQRLALARALLLEPPILILDDPTASVDPKTEHEIVSALRQAMAGRTTFVVANRLSLLRRADVILVLEKGGWCRWARTRNWCACPAPTAKRRCCS